MRDFFRSVRLGAAWLMGLALLSPLAAQSPADQQAAEGTVNIYNLDREAHVGGIEIHGPISKAVVSQAVQLIRSIRPDVDDLKVFLSSPGDVLAAMELARKSGNNRLGQPWTNTGSASAHVCSSWRQACGESLRPKTWGFSA